MNITFLDAFPTKREDYEKVGFFKKFGGIASCQFSYEKTGFSCAKDYDLGRTGKFKIYQNITTKELIAIKKEIKASDLSKGKKTQWINLFNRGKSK